MHLCCRVAAVVSEAFLSEEEAHIDIALL